VLVTPPVLVEPPTDVEPPTSVELAVVVEPPVAVALVAEPPFPAAADELAEPEEPPGAEEPPELGAPAVAEEPPGLPAVPDDPPVPVPDAVVWAHNPPAAIRKATPAIMVRRATAFGMLAGILRPSGGRGSSLLAEDSRPRVEGVGRASGVKAMQLG
jgi:hypothetical protein